MAKFDLRSYGFKAISDVVDESILKVKDYKEGKIHYYPSKWHRYNNYLMGGSVPGKVVVIGARPGMGKSAFSTQLIIDTLDVNKDRKLLALLWSMEMEGTDHIARIGANKTKKELYYLFSIDANLSDEHLLEYIQAVSEYRKYPIYFCEKPVTPGTIIQVNREVAKAQPEWQVINLYDHTRLIEGGRGDSDELAAINRFSKTIFTQNRELKTIDIILSQLNRKIESEARAKGGFKPLTSDLFGADSLGQDADVIIMLNRPYDVYGLQERYEGYDPKGLLAAHITKNRGGKLGMLPFDFDAKHFSITERDELVNLKPSSTHKRKKRTIVEDTEEIF